MTTGTITVDLRPAYYANNTWAGGDGRPAWNNFSRSTSLRTQVPNWQGYMGTLFVPSNFVAQFSSNDEISLVNGIAEAIKGHQFNLGVALGERKQTMDLVISTVGKFTNVVRSLRKGRFDLALRHIGSSPAVHKKLYPARKMRSDPRTLVSKDISVAWLELQYGWLPLLSDIHESAKAYEKLTTKVPTYTQRVCKKVSVSHNFEKLVVPYLGNGYAVGKSTSTLLISLIARYTCPPSTTRSLGLQDPASIAWELLPFSFVADWFIPIGPYLEAVHTIPNLPDATFCKSVLAVDSLSYSGWGYNGYYLGASGSTKEVRFTRTILSSYSVPTPTFKAIDKAFSADHVKNAVALLHQLVT